MIFPFFKKTKITVSSIPKYLSKLDGEITCQKTFPAIQPKFSDFTGLNEELILVLNKMGISSLYSHQSKAITLAAQKKDFVVVTPTSSGKTLCYNLPVLNKILIDSETRALYLFPTKALANDQLSELTKFLSKLDKGIKCFTYDGDTQSTERRKAKEYGNVIISNPDMLNTAILPHHKSWGTFFRNLNFIVIDELHTYRGVFGSHLANLLIRLQRICEFYESNPIFICSSATIANPLEHAEVLTGRDMTLILENGAPSPEKDFIIYNPPITDKQTRTRRSSLLTAAQITTDALLSGINSIVFTRSRINVELMLKQVKKEILKKNGDPSIVAGYRAGYLPEERRKIERDLKERKLSGVISTNALELGIDIGALDLTILHGYPGSIASTWQQIGRAGRSGKKSSAILIPLSTSADQFIAYNGNWLLNSNPEMPRINTKNPYILIKHIVCSAFELPFQEGELFGKKDITKILNYLAKNKILNKMSENGITKYYSFKDSFPAGKLSLRSTTSKVYTIYDISTPKKLRAIGSISKHTAPITVHPEAVYFHKGKSYLVEKLDSKNMLCNARPLSLNYYTEAKYTTHININKILEQSNLFGFGEVTISTRPYMYKKIDLTTHETVGWGKIDLSDETLQTTATWISIPTEAANDMELKKGMEGLKMLLKNIIPLFLMCDREDILVLSRQNDPNLERPAIFVADNIPGGVGIADGMYETIHKLLSFSLDSISSCTCSKGCLGCVGIIPSEYNPKTAVQRLILKILNKNHVS